MSGTAIVVGAGIGGLAAAIGLRRIGWDVTVLERSPEVGEIGAGMSQAPNALRALDALGVGDRARAAGTPFFATTNLREPSGRYLMRPLGGPASAAGLPSRRPARHSPRCHSAGVDPDRNESDGLRTDRGTGRGPDRVRDVQRRPGRRR
ncbi:FAD-dependent oxidoreductase [Glycomyces niveus]|uniref:FAD-dependent monooxygenase n=1 Tax=Glycomyces niveus TaxID=2820287 RepID=A0ABS3U211_9ACTN|nr:FAD-dependent monooxygenase [Glycomyces sp. NEAU-S30]